MFGKRVFREKWNKIGERTLGRDGSCFAWMLGPEVGFWSFTLHKGIPLTKSSYKKIPYLDGLSFATKHDTYSGRRRMCNSPTIHALICQVEEGMDPKWGIRHRICWNLSQNRKGSFFIWTRAVLKMTPILTSITIISRVDYPGNRAHCWSWTTPHVCIGSYQVVPPAGQMITTFRRSMFTNFHKEASIGKWRS
jgi:hypothetical protein